MLEWERIETKWKERDFQDWLTDQEKSQDGDLRKAIAFIRKAHDLGRSRLAAGGPALCQPD